MTTSSPTLTCLDYNTKNFANALMISDTKFFVVAQDSTAGIASFIVMDVSTPSHDWNKHMAWPDGATCTLTESTSILNSDDTKIHSLVNYGDTNRRLVFSTLSVTDGSLVGNVYASNVTGWSKASAMRLNGSKIYMLGYCSIFQFLIYDDTTKAFTIYKSVSSVR